MVKAVSLLCRKQNKSFCLQKKYPLVNDVGCLLTCSSVKFAFENLRFIKGTLPVLPFPILYVFNR